MKLLFGFSIVLLMAISSADAFADWGDVLEKSRTERVGPANGRTQARLYVPKKSSTLGRPLIILLHGFSFEAERNLRYLNLRETAAEGDALLLVPEGTRTRDGLVFWNATDFCCDTDGARPDDVTYLLSLVADVKASHNVDPNRIYLIGYSNGAFMANRLACETKGVFSAIVSIAGGTFKNESSCRSKHPISFLQIHADDDATIVFENDSRYAGGRETYDRYLKENKCDLASSSTRRLDLVSNRHGAETVATSHSCIDRTETAIWLMRAGTGKIGHKPNLTKAFAPDVLVWLLRQKRYASIARSP